MMWKIQQAMEDDAIRTARIHPGNRDEVFIWQNFQPAYRDLSWKNRDLGNRASPVKRAHMKRPSVLCAFCLWIILQSKFFHLLILRKIAFYRVYMGELKIYKYKYRPRSKELI